MKASSIAGPLKQRALQTFDLTHRFIILALGVSISRALGSLLFAFSIGGTISAKAAGTILQRLAKHCAVLKRLPDDVNAEKACSYGWYLQERGMFEPLLILTETATSILKSIGEQDSMLMGEIYNTMGNVYLEIGDAEACDNYFQMVRDIREKHCPPDHPDIANITQNLSLSKAALGDYNAAVQLTNKALCIREGTKGDAFIESYKSTTIPITYSNVCRILCMKGDYETAGENGEKGIIATKKAFGLYSKVIEEAYFNLADVRWKQSRVKEAVTLHLQALRLRKTTLGDHYQTAASCYKLGIIFQE
ncbi:hypothetical protein K440DRAFT_641869 [Wilcoxina mikolae CBS 423.85]|nr:hypothetical protein K440DRAFT_641869 [Wilcoxina mikolae CBS 423.85]